MGQKREHTIAGCIEANAGLTDQPALTWYRDGALQTRYSYQDLRKNVAIVACNLVRLKVYPKDRVVVLSNNCPELFFLNLAIMSLGAIVAPVNPLESPRILKHILSILQPTLVVFGKGAEHFRTLCSQTPIDELWFASDKTFDFTKAKASHHDTAVILFTSGTTSEPKGVCLSHLNLLTNARGLHKVHNLRENKTHMCVLPLFHANAFGFSMITSIFAGSHVVLCNGFPGHSIWSIIGKEEVNIVSVVPQILQILGARSPSVLPGDHLRYFVSAAAPLSNKVASDFITKTGIKIHQGYGLSECVNFATTIPSDIPDGIYQHVMFEEKIPSIGSPIDGCDVFVRGPQGLALEGQEAEIIVTGDTLMSGYWRNAEATGNVVKDGVLHTGDLGFYKTIENRRFFFLTGRIKDIINRNGEKISPLAIEADLQELRTFGKFAVAGFENSFSGEEVGLYLKAEDKIDQVGIRQVLKCCQPFYRPKLVLIGHQDIPTTPTGKVKRQVLGERFAAFSSHLFSKNPIIVAERGAKELLKDTV